MRSGGRAARAWTALLALLVAPAAARGQGAPEAAPSLGRGVPSDAVVYLHARLDAAGDLWQRLGSLREALGSSGFGDSFRERLLEILHGKEDDSAPERKAALRKRLESEIRDWQAAAAAIDWWDLFARESVVAARPNGEGLDWLFLARIDPASREQLIASLDHLIDVLCSAGRDLETLGSLRDGEFIRVLYRNPEAKPGAEEAISVLYNTLAGLLGRGLEVSLAATGDVLVVATSRSLLARSLQLLAGGGSDLGYALSPRREALLARLPAASAPAAPAAPAATSAALEVHVYPAAALAGVPAAAGIEDFVLRGTSDGKSLAYAYRAGAAAADRKGGEGSREAFLARPAALDLLAWIPADATSFHVTSGAEPRAVLAIAGTLLSGCLPAALLETPQVEAWAELAGEIAGRLTGRRAFLSDASGGWVVLFEPADSFRWHASLAPRVQAALEKLGGELATREIEGGAALVFRSQGPPGKFECFTGSARGAFFLGNSEALLGRALATRAGSAPAATPRPEITEKPALPPGDLLRAGDSRIGPLFSFAAGAFAVLAREAAAEIEAEDDPLGKALLETLPRLAPAIEALGFLDHLASRRVRQGEAILGAGTVTFEEPRKF